jgi:glycosidase
MTNPRWGHSMKSSAARLRCRCAVLVAAWVFACGCGRGPAVQDPKAGTANLAVAGDATAATARRTTGYGGDANQIGPAARSHVAGRAASSRDAAAAGWAADAIFYQIFPERFRNGDPTNDPTRDSLESPDLVPESWAITPWTSDWYARAGWEQELGESFYGDGVFHRRYGGDLEGIIGRLTYLQTLGISAIYLNPVFYARSLHKYDGNSFHHVDPHFGPDPAGDLALMAQETSDPASWHWTAADKLFLDLIREAHAVGIRVVIDGVFNHTGRDFFAFADLRRKQADSRYKDWYIVQAFDDPATPQNELRYRGWWGVDTLPEFANNQSGTDLHAGPKQYVFDITTRWMDPNGDGDTTDGIDGWRLDVATEVPVGFWGDWHEHVRRINPQCYTVAEMWHDAADFVSEGGFSATMNYYAFSFPVKGFVIDSVLSPSEAALQLGGRRAAFPASTQYLLLNLIDSHDTDRVASMIVNTGRRPYAQPERFDYDIEVSPRYAPDYDVRKPNATERRIQRLVGLLQMTYVGPPMIYYGTEVGMWGADDPCDRMPMVWPDLTYEPQQADPLGRPRQPDAVEFDSLLHGFYRAAVWLRREFPALRRGSIEFVHADDAARFLAFRRSDNTETLLVGLNRGDAEYHWEFPLAAGESVSQIFTASGEIDSFSVKQQPELAVVVVPPYDGLVLELQREE